MQYLTALLLTLALWLTDSTAQAAPEALQALQNTTRGLTQLQGRFTQTQHLAALNLPLESSGAFHYSKTGGVEWHTQHPIDSTLLISPDYQLHTLDASGKRVPLRTPEILSRLFLGIFSGDTALLAELFNVQPQTAEKGWRLQLTPREPALAAQLKSITISGDDTVKALSFTEANGDRRDISLQIDTVERAEP